MDISAKEPLQYLRERVERAAGHLGEQAIRERLDTHVVPYDALAVGGYDQITDPDQRAARIRAGYANFLQSRAKALLDPIGALCNGLDL